MLGQYRSEDNLLVTVIHVQYYKYCYISIVFSISLFYQFLTKDAKNYDNTNIFMARHMTNVPQIFTVSLMT